MVKIKDFIIKHKLYFMYLFLIVAILFAISIKSGIYPLGNHTLIKYDLAFQYYPMMQEIYDRIYDSRSLVYSFNDGLGLPLYRNFIYYLSCPINLLFLIIKDHMLAVHLIIFIKIGLIGFTMLFYLKRKFKTDNPIILIPTLCYAFCGWINAYNLNIMWLDGLIMLPLITLGIESLINEKKYKLYIFSLAIAIITNYYLGFMICIFSLVYFLFYNVYKIKTKGSLNYKINELSRNLIYFGMASVMAAILSAVVLYPTIKCMSSLSDKIDGYENQYVFETVDFLAANLANSTSTALCIESAGEPNAPNIYTGIISLFLIVPFILNKKIKLSSKITYILLFILFILMMKVTILDYIMNGLHIPAGFPYRYSFMYSFIICIISTYTLLNLKDIKYRDIIISSILVSIIPLIVYLVGTNKIESNYVLYNYIYIAIITICLLLKKYKVSSILLVIAVSVELVITFTISSKLYSLELLDDYYKKTYYGEMNKPGTNEFYRETAVDGELFSSLVDDYYGISSSSSMSYSSIYQFGHNIGLGTDYSAYIYYTPGSYLANILFSIKDIHTTTEIKTNENRLSLIYGVDKKFDRELNDSPNFFNLSNLIAQDMTGITDLYTMNKYKSKKTLFEDDNFIVIEYTYPKNTVLKPYMSDVGFVLANDVYYSVYQLNIDYKVDYSISTTLVYPYMIDASDGKVTVGYFKSNFDEEDIVSFQLDEKKAKQVYDYLNRYPAEIKYFSEDYIETSIKLDNDMSIMSSIPYDEGWHVYVDGNEVSTYGQYKAFLGFDLPKGEHNIVLKYKTPYVKEGLIISGISLLSLIGFDIVIRRRKNKKATSKKN